MESIYSDPQLSLQPFDTDVFQRVWKRVMPDQELSPIALRASTAPVPAPQAVPALSPLPEAPPEAAPDAPLTCLGEESRPYAQTIQALMEQTQGLRRTVQRLSRRANARAGRTLNALSSQLERELRRLSTAHFLITGERYTPSQQGEPLPAPLDQALRALFQQLHQRAAQARAAAQGMGDPCLQQLFQDLGEDAEFHAQRLRALLEEMP